MSSRDRTIIQNYCNATLRKLNANELFHLNRITQLDKPIEIVLERKCLHHNYLWTWFISEIRDCTRKCLHIFSLLFKSKYKHCKLVFYSTLKLCLYDFIAVVWSTQVQYSQNHQGPPQKPKLYNYKFALNDINLVTVVGTCINHYLHLVKITYVGLILLQLSNEV